MIMENLTLLKLKLSVLWIIMGVAGYRCTAYFESGVIESIKAGEWAAFQTPEMMLFTTLMWLIPLFMAFLSLTLKDSINRWTNIILGIVWTGSTIFHLSMHFTIPAICTVHQVLIVGSTVVVAALIAWYAWKWK
jgi:hypothetical protein